MLSIRKFVIIFLTVILAGCASVSKESSLQKSPNIKISYLFDNITIEIQPTSEIQPNLVELNILASKAQKYRLCLKKNVTFIFRPQITGEKLTWNRKDILQFQDEYRTLWDLDHADRHLIIFMGYLSGNRRGVDNNAIIGTAYSDFMMIMLFRKEKSHATILHEIGHLIGLVDRSDRDDLTSPGTKSHCGNKKCVMYWLVNRSGEFDRKCQDDIDRKIKGIL